MVNYTENTNITQNNSFIFVGRLEDARVHRFVTNDYWKIMKNKKMYVNFQKYQIKETDFQQKTATFSSPDYFDLTTGLYTILITSPYHENFAGVILSVEYDKNEGMYNYQCQDWSRLYQGTINLVSSNATYYNILRCLITQFGISNPEKITSSQLKQYKQMLSGLRPLDYYNMDWWGNSKKINPLKYKKKVIIKNKTFMEAINDIVYGAGGYIRVYFNQRGILQVEPFNRKEWLTNGVYVTTKELASQTLTFDTTNVITGVVVNNSGLDGGVGYSSDKVLNLDLSVFFGNLGTSIDTSNKNGTIVNASATTEKEGNNINVHMNTDKIYSSSTDKQMLNDIKKILKNKGYKVTIGSRGPNAHYKEINKVKKNGIYFTIVGGLCAGSLRGLCIDNHYWNVLKKKNAKMVIGHLTTASKYKLNKNLTWLPRAHDDNFSPKNFKGWKNPYKNLVKKGIGIAEGGTAKQIANKFPNFPNSKKGSAAIITSTDSKEITKDKKNAIKEIGKPIRDFLKMKVTIPLGNPNLKNVHTNMFLYTELPNEFILSNFSTIANAIKSSYSRNEGYKLNRWYIETVTINNEGSKFTMELELNPFPSQLVDYVENLKEYTSEYTDAEKQNKSANTTSKTTTKAETDNYTNVGSRTDGKTACNDTYYLSTKQGRTNIKKLQNKSENKLATQTIGKTGTNYAKFVKGCKTAKEVYKKLCTIIPAKVAGYANCKYKCAEDAYKHPKNLNCAERSRLFKASCDSLNIPCVIYHVEGHYLNGVKINGKWETADLCYRSGLSHKEYNSAKFNK